MERGIDTNTPNNTEPQAMPEAPRLSELRAAKRITPAAHCIQTIARRLYQRPIAFKEKPAEHETLRAFYAWAQIYLKFQSIAVITR